MEKNKKLEERINIIENEISKSKRKDRIFIIIIVLLILVLLTLCLLGYKLGKIGYSSINTSGTIENDIDLIRITDNDGFTWKNNELQVFKNANYNGKKIIAPHSSGIYKFYVKNETENNIAYNIRLIDEMSHFVNMKYKLKIDNVYICGNTNNYVEIDKLNIDNIVLMKSSTTLYSLEWYWEDNDKLDTYVGGLKTDEYYTLKFNIQATKITNEQKRISSLLNS